MIILRLLHILGGVVWAGTVSAMVLFVYPAMKAAGPSGQPFARALGQHTKLGLAMPLAAVVTLLSGLMMYGQASGGMSKAWLATPAAIVLTIGGALALIAFFGPGLMTMRVQKRLATLGQEIAKGGGAPSEPQRSELVTLQARMPRLGLAVFWLLGITVICMATFRYV